MVGNYAFYRALKIRKPFFILLILWKIQSVCYRMNESIKVWGKEGERVFFSHWVEVDELIIFLSDIHLSMWEKLSSRSFMNCFFFLLAHQTSVNEWGVIITFPLSSVLGEKKERCLQSSAESLLQSEQTEKMLLIAHMAQSCLPSSLFPQLSHTVRVWRKNRGWGELLSFFIFISAE